MLKIIKLSTSYLRYNKWMSITLIICITISIFIPFFTFRISSLANEILSGRAAETPIVIGRKGGHLNLVLNTLYFKTDTPDMLDYEVYTRVLKDKPGKVIPIYNKHKARNYPVIGTTLAYFDLRELAIRDGNYMQILGDAVLGYNTAKRLGLSVGQTIISDTGSLYNISSIYPLKMTITGILEKRNSPDDNVIFTDLKTCWIMDGIGHGHKDLRTSDDSEIYSKTSTNIAGNPSVYEYTKITSDNIKSFHFHGNKDKFPLTALIVVPDNEKKQTILKANINLSDTLQAIMPAKITGDLLKLIFNIRKILSSYFGLVIISTVCFLVLMISLSLQIRSPERHIMQMIGSSRYTIFFILFMQITTIVFISTIISVLSTHLVIAVIKQMQFI